MTMKSNSLMLIVGKGAQLLFLWEGDRYIIIIVIIIGCVFGGGEG